MRTFNFQVLLIALVAAVVATVSPASAEGKSCSAVSGFLFTDFDMLASANPVANCSLDVSVGPGTVNIWAQTGVDTEWTEIDVIGSTPTVDFGPVQVGASGGVYYLPEQDEDTILTATVFGSTTVAGFRLQAESQWYWDGLEDSRLGLSVGRTFTVAEQVALDVEVGQSWFESGGRHAYLAVNLPIAMDGFTLRPFGKATEHHAVFGVAVDW